MTLHKFAASNQEQRTDNVSRPLCFDNKEEIQVNTLHHVHGIENIGRMRSLVLELLPNKWESIDEVWKSLFQVIWVTIPYRLGRGHNIQGECCFGLPYELFPTWRFHTLALGVQRV